MRLKLILISTNKRVPRRWSFHQSILRKPCFVISSRFVICYMHFNNYFVEHIRGDMRLGGRGVITKILNKEGRSLAIYMVCRGGLTEIVIFPTYFSLPHLYINNDRSLSLGFFLSSMLRHDPNPNLHKSCKES